MRSCAFLLLALGLHLLILFMVFVLVSDPDIVTQENWVFVEPETSSAEQDAKAAPTPSLSELGLGRAWQEHVFDSTQRGEQTKSTETGPGEEKGAGGLLDSFRDTVSLDVLYRRLDEVIYYPREFINAGIEGSITGTLVFNAAGEFVPKDSKIQARSSYLRVFILKSFRHALEPPLPPTLRHPEGLRITFVVNFELTRLDNSMDMSEKANFGRGIQKGVSGHTFAYHRAAKVVGQWTLGPFSGYGITPQVGVNPEWFIDGIKKLVNKITKRKAEIDPLEIYRNNPAWRKADQTDFGP